MKGTGEGVRGTYGCSTSSMNSFLGQECSIPISPPHPFSTSASLPNPHPHPLPRQQPSLASQQGASHSTSFYKSPSPPPHLPLSSSLFSYPRKRETTGHVFPTRVPEGRIPGSHRRSYQRIPVGASECYRLAPWDCVFTAETTRTRDSHIHPLALFRSARYVGRRTLTYLPILPHSIAPIHPRRSSRG